MRIVQSLRFERPAQFGELPCPAHFLQGDHVRLQAAELRMPKRAPQDLARGVQRAQLRLGDGETHPSGYGVEPGPAPCGVRNKMRLTPA